MQFSFSTKKYSIIISAALCLAISGCASYNPLIDEPTPPVQSSTPPPTISNIKTNTDSVKTTELTGFDRVLNFFSPYKIDIFQGNFVSKEMMANIKEGQTRDQVKFILGTPLLVDIFHPKRWDYPFRITKSNGEVTTSHVSIFFDQNNKVASFKGGNLPTEQEYLARIAGDTTTKTPTPQTPK